MTLSDLPDPIRALDVAVVDEDLLWRVEVMNALRPLYATDFASVAALADRVHLHDRTVVLLGRDLTETVAEELAAIRADRPGVSVVGVAGEQVPEDGLEGVDLVLPADIDDQELVDLLRWVVEERRTAGDADGAGVVTTLAGEAPEREARLVLVTSAKGGVGRSTVALNLATLLARQAPDEQVALVETDAVYGDLGRLLHLRGPGPMRDLWPDHVTDAMVRDDCTFEVGADGLRVVLPPELDDPWSPLGPADARVLVRGAAATADWIVVDVSPHLLHGSELVSLADVVYVVASTELTGLANATTLVGALRRESPRPHAVNLVLVDRAGQGRAAQVVAEAACAPVVATIPNDRHASAAAIEGHPLVDRHPHAGASRALRSLAERTRTALATGPAPTA